MLIIGLLVSLFLTRHMEIFGEIIVISATGVWCGYWLHALMLFGHEAAHDNIARSYNDTIANWTIWLPFGLTTARYRSTHWEHHLHLGDHEDTERSYHNCMHPWFLLQLVSGIYFMKMLVAYHGSTAKKHALSKESGAIVALLRSLLFHLIIIGGLWFLDSVTTIIMWLLAASVFFPLFATVRQVLEHRQSTATCERDFTQEEHGPINRMFGTDFFSRYFGAAGFNRHLLHHWDPTVSYTRFDDMEKFMRQTPLQERLKTAKTTYKKTCLHMLRSALHD